jgi:Protein of unknown function (DUF3307)
MGLDHSAVNLFWLLLVGHAIADYPLQGDFLSRGKNHKNPIPGVPWYQCLAAHSIIHSGSVFLLTGGMALAFAEFFAHCLIDYNKCAGRYGFNVDQALHIACKVAWVIIWSRNAWPGAYIWIS